MVGRGGILGVVAVIAGMVVADAALAQAVPITAEPVAPAGGRQPAAGPSQPVGIHNFQVKQLDPAERDAFRQARAAQLAAHPPRPVPALPQQRVTPGPGHGP